MKPGTCRHFNGVQNRQCKAGVAYDEVRPEGFRLPCLPPGQDTRRPGLCGFFEEVTAEDMAARRAMIDDALERMRKAEPVVKKFRTANKGRSNRTAVPCPACGTGTLHMTIAAYNGHVHSRCTTDGCLSWME